MHVTPKWSTPPGAQNPFGLEQHHRCVVSTRDGEWCYRDEIGISTGRTVLEKIGAYQTEPENTCRNNSDEDRADYRVREFHDG